MEERIRQVIASARLIDDTFMSAVFRNPKCSQVLVNCIMPEENFVVEESRTQPEMKNLYGRSVRLDILVRDGNGRHCNIEIQRKAQGAVPQRARYNCALVDMNTFQRREDFSALSDTYVVFIVEDDVLRVGLPLIHVDRIIRETGAPFEDGTHILYVNANNMDDTPLGRLMQDMYCRNVDGIMDPILREEVRYYKEDKGGREYMCELVEKIYSEELAEIKKTQFISSVRAGLTKELIMQIMDITVEEYNEYLLKCADRLSEV